MHPAYGGVVPELASRDPVRRVLPLAKEVLAESGKALANVDRVACTHGPSLTVARARQPSCWAARVQQLLEARAALR